MDAKTENKMLKDGIKDLTLIIDAIEIEAEKTVAENRKLRDRVKELEAVIHTMTEVYGLGSGTLAEIISVTNESYDLLTKEG